MNHPIRCRCGKVRGHLVVSRGATRALCYCKDCQAYARFIGTPGVVDRNGGTEVVASLPKHVQLTGGIDALACLSLSERGLLRWFASCCETPIANTPRNPALPYAGVMRCCLEGNAVALERSFGPLRVAVNTRSARGKVRSSAVANAAGTLKLMTSLFAARLGGAYKVNPFFEPNTRTPIRPVRVLTGAERELAYRPEA